MQVKRGARNDIPLVSISALRLRGRIRRSQRGPQVHSSVLLQMQKSSRKEIRKLLLNPLYYTCVGHGFKSLQRPVIVLVARFPESLCFTEERERETRQRRENQKQETAAHTLSNVRGDNERIEKSQQIRAVYLFINYPFRIPNYHILRYTH